MGWLYMRDMDGYATPRSYLDNQFTFDNETHRLTVMASAMVGSTYYAACESVTADKRQVFAIICLTRYNPRAADGFVFGYKDMDESMGPCATDCPAAILDLLTDTTCEYAIQWRAACRANLERRKQERAKPIPKPGQTIIFDTAMRFQDGIARDRFTVVANPRGKAPLFRDTLTGALCRISRLKTHSYRLINPAIVVKDAADG